MLQTNYAKTELANTLNWKREIYIAPDLSGLHLLTADDRADTLAFLSVRPVHTVVMTSYILDNAFDSNLNRGKFYGYRGDDGNLEGVALIGHSTLFDAHSEKALAAFALAARTSETPIHLIMSSGDAADRFWEYYSTIGSKPRLRCEERLFSSAFPFPVQNCEMNVNVADETRLILVAEAQAEIAFIECGVDPMVRDRAGFLKRVQRRIEQGRVFTVFQNGKLIFKADIIAETNDVIYLEGVYVHPEYRGKGVGSRCLSALTVELMSRVSYVTLLSNIDFDTAHRSFEKAGYRSKDSCVTLFV